VVCIASVCDVSGVGLRCHVVICVNFVVVLVFFVVFGYGCFGVLFLIFSWLVGA